MGCTSAIVFTCFGAAYGTAKSGVGISAMGVLRPDLIVKSMSTSFYLLVIQPRLYTLTFKPLIRVDRYRPCDYGWYHRYLRIGRFGFDLRWFEAGASIIYRVYSIGSWAKCRPCGSCSWVSHVYNPPLSRCQVKLTDPYIALLSVLSETLVCVALHSNQGYSSAWFWSWFSPKF